MPSKRIFYGYSTRYIVAWVVIVLSIIASTALILYNNNAVMTLFNKGKITLKNYDDMLEIVSEAPDTYTITVLSGEDLEADYVEFHLNGGAVSFRIVGKSNEITAISGEIDLTALDISRPVRLYSTMDNALKPLCNRKDILAAEITVLKFVQHIDFLSYNENVVYETNYNNMGITIERERYSPTTIYFSIIIL